MDGFFKGIKNQRWYYSNFLRSKNQDRPTHHLLNLRKSLYLERGLKRLKVTNYIQMYKNHKIVPNHFFFKFTHTRLKNLGFLFYVYILKLYFKKKLYKRTLAVFLINTISLKIWEREGVISPSAASCIDQLDCFILNCILFRVFLSLWNQTVFKAYCKC